MTSQSSPIILGVIPARYGSTRFPGKPLALLAGKPMIQHVVERARRAGSLDRVVVATDDQRIAQAVEAFGGEVVLTGDHPTGTDRIAEAARLVERSTPVGMVVNVQGDEPLLDPADLDRLTAGLAADPQAHMATLVYPLKDEEEFHDPNVVKVTLDARGRALYFSRAPIPFPRGEGTLGWRHLGVYAFRRNFLAEFARMAPTPLAQRESLEQLRALENGHAIQCIQAGSFSIGVDTPGDLAKAETLLSGRKG
ncbi:MAG: 3-deoxy-manno-octulosonate cytidylyltransferase [Deltaproteobacteria bacterium]|nr:3-deoxy-manno-octulosonate cytidylyltransferase [Deltaproteobacteria bacterium]